MTNRSRRERLGSLYYELCYAMAELNEARRDAHVALIRRHYNADDIGWMVGVIAQEISYEVEGHRNESVQQGRSRRTHG